VDAIRESVAARRQATTMHYRLIDVK